MDVARALSATAKASAWRRVTFFALPKKVTKERRFPRHYKPIVSLVRAIFRLGILPRRKTAHIHVRRPSGLDEVTGGLPWPKGEKKKKAKSEAPTSRNLKADEAGCPGIAESAPWMAHGGESDHGWSDRAAQQYPDSPPPHPEPARLPSTSARADAPEARSTYRHHPPSAKLPP